MKNKSFKIIKLVFTFSLILFLTIGSQIGRSDEEDYADCVVETFRLVGTEQIFEQEGENIFIYVPYETDISDIKTEITLAGQATIRPPSGTVMDFTHPQELTVKSSDGNEQTLTVTVEKSPWRQVLANETAPFLKTDGHTLVVFKDKMWLLGGWLGRFDHDQATFTVGGDHWTSQVWCTSDGKNWESKGNAPWAGRHGFGCVVHDDKLWVIGGDQHTDVWNTEDGVTWNKISDTVPWGERYFPYIVSFKGKIWVMGGMRVAFTESPRLRDKYNDVWSTTDGVHWTQEAEFVDWLPRGMISGTAILNDELYIFGGSILYSYAFNDVWKTGDGVHWTKVTSHAPWPARSWGSIAAFDNKLWVLAGDFDITNNRMLNDVWYSSDGATWTQQQGVFWKPRHATPVIEFQNKLWLVGGLISRNDGGVSNEVWVMDIKE